MGGLECGVLKATVVHDAVGPFREVAEHGLAPQGAFVPGEGLEASAFGLKGEDVCAVQGIGGLSGRCANGRSGCSGGRDDEEGAGIRGVYLNERLKEMEHEGLAGARLAEKEDTREMGWGRGGGGDSWISGAIPGAQDLKEVKEEAQGKTLAIVVEGVEGVEERTASTTGRVAGKGESWGAGGGVEVGGYLGNEGRCGGS